MDVVVDEVVAVLQVLAFRDAISADQQVNLCRFVRQHDGFLLRTRREEGEQFLEVVALLERGLRRTFAGDFRAVQGLCG